MKSLMLLFGLMGHLAVADNAVTVVSGGNQATIKVELSNMLVKSHKSAKAGEVYELVPAVAPEIKVPSYFVWTCGDLSDDLLISMNTLNTAIKNYLAVFVDIEATFRKPGDAVLCLKNARIAEFSLTTLLSK